MMLIIVGVAILIVNVLNLICIAVNWHNEPDACLKNHYGLIMSASIALTVIMVAGVYYKLSTTPLLEM